MKTSVYKDYFRFALGVLIPILIIGVAVFLVLRNNHAANHPTVYTFEISEISSGIYAYREEAVSRAPAYNYTMATFADKDGNIYTVKGRVNAVNYTEGNPYVVWEHKKVTNSDSVTIYAPSGTVVYRGAITIH